MSISYELLTFIQLLTAFSYRNLGPNTLTCTDAAQGWEWTLHRQVTHLLLIRCHSELVAGSTALGWVGGDRPWTRLCSKPKSVCLMTSRRRCTEQHADAVQHGTCLRSHMLTRMLPLLRAWTTYQLARPSPCHGRHWCRGKEMGCGVNRFPDAQQCGEIG